LLCVMLGLVFAWSTYQALTPIVISTLVVPVLSERWKHQSRWSRLLFVASAFVASLAIYYSLWRLANVDLLPDNRYSPASIGWHVLENLDHYRTLRIPVIFSLWDTSLTDYRYYGMFLFSVLAIGAAIDVREATHRLSRVATWVAAAALVVVVDLPLFFAPTNNFSYMTSAPGAIAVFLIGASAVSVIGRQAIVIVPRLLGAVRVAVATACTIVVMLSARNVLVNHVLPNWLEYALVRSELRRELRSGSRISTITVFPRSSLLGGGWGEFSWSNFADPFWAHWAIRDILDELGAESRIRIEVVNPNGSLSIMPASRIAESFTPPGVGRHVTIDLRDVNLSVPSPSTVHEPAPLPGYQNFWVRKRAWDAVPKSMATVPAGAVSLAIARIHSTLTFTEAGAGGERAAIDGDLKTWAADPDGFHRGTAIGLSLQYSGDVTGIRILSARDNGIEAPGTMKVSCDPDGHLREVATLNLQPGKETISEVFWQPPCHTALIRLEAIETAASTNFWIAEIQAFGRAATR
jgi:hypothetical protein